MLRLTENEIQSLIHQPESGMGYQVVDVVTTTGLRKKGVVVSSQVLFLDEELIRDRQELRNKSFTEVIRSAYSSTGRFTRLTVVEDVRSTKLAARAAHGAGGADQAAIGTTENGERFFRFSAFVNDRRIAADFSLVPGTYATTFGDGGKVRSGREAVERYALPNEDPASYRFLVSPNTGTFVQHGIVQPANGHAGGGHEVIFTTGTQPRTVSLPPDHLPD